MNGNHVNDDDVDDFFFAYSADSASFLAHIDIHTESKRQCDGVADEAKNEKRSDEERKKETQQKEEEEERKKERTKEKMQERKGKERKRTRRRTRELVVVLETNQSSFC